MRLIIWTLRSCGKQPKLSPRRKPTSSRSGQQVTILQVGSPWCAARGLVAIPATPATVAAFLTSEADRGFRPVTIAGRAAAIAAAHRAQDHPNPCDSGAVTAVMSGIRREHGARPRRKAAPLQLDARAGNRCAVRAVQAWLQAAGIHRGPVFRRMLRSAGYADAELRALARDRDGHRDFELLQRLFGELGKTAGN